MVLLEINCVSWSCSLQLLPMAPFLHGMPPLIWACSQLSRWPGVLACQETIRSISGSNRGKFLPANVKAVALGGQEAKAPLVRGGGWPFRPRYGLCWAACLELRGKEWPQEALRWMRRGCWDRKASFLLDWRHPGPRLLWVRASGFSRNPLSISAEKPVESNSRVCQKTGPVLLSLTLGITVFP